METQKHIEAYQLLFNHMANQHGLTLLQSEMDEIIQLSKGVVIKYDSISDVVGRSEQLFCHHKGKYTLTKEGVCCKCRRPPKAK